MYMRTCPPQRTHISIFSHCNAHYNKCNALAKCAETRYDNKLRSTRDKRVIDDTHRGHGIKCVGLIYAPIYFHGQFHIMRTLI